MGVGYRDFNGDPVGQLPAGLTNRHGNQAVTVQDSGFSGHTGRFLRISNGTGGTERLTAINELDGRTNVEILARTAFANNTNVYKLYGYARSTTNPNTSSYFGGWTRTTGWATLEKMVSGSWTGSLGTSKAALGTVATHTWYWVRFRVQSNTLSLKVWLSTDSEPSQWTAVATDSSHSSGSSRFAGFGVYAGNEVVAIDRLGWAWDGDTAPSAPVGPPAVDANADLSGTGTVTATGSTYGFTAGSALVVASWSPDPGGHLSGTGRLAAAALRVKEAGPATLAGAGGGSAEGNVAAVHADASLAGRSRAVSYAWPVLGMYRGWGATGNLNQFALDHDLDVLYGHEFGDGTQWSWFTSGTNFGSWEAWVNARIGRRFTYSAPLLADNAAGNQATRYAALAAGTYDHHFVTLGNAFQARPALRNAIVRLGWEFNGLTFPWRVPPNDQTTLDNYKVGFARAVSALRSACPTLEIEWCPNIQLDYTNRPFDDMVPHPESFDYVGLGQYDYYWPGGSPSAEQRADWLIEGATGVNGWRHQAQIAKDLGKRAAWTEYGLWQASSLSGGGDRPAYLQLVADWMTEHRYAYHIYNNVTADGGHDLDDHPNSRQAFTDLFGRVTPADAAAAGRGTASAEAAVVIAAARTKIGLLRTADDHPLRMD